MADERTVGREPIQIVEILQPYCSRTFGVAPCTAIGTADTKCYNTRATCQDTPNFALGAPLSLFFSRGNVVDAVVSGAPYIIPSLVSVSTAPTKINLAGSDPDATGLGNRAVCSLTFEDHAHSDRRVDPYVAGRSWNPMDAARGSFWTRWIARNKYRQNVQIRIYEGYVGQALAAMKRRTYFMQSISGPDAGGKITIMGKDILAKLEERKAQAPAASPGKLFAAMLVGDMSLEATNCGITDYPATGTVRIGDELLTYSARIASANGVTFTVTARGTDGSTAVAHSLNDSVQQCLRFVNQTVDAVLNTLLATYGGIAAGFLNTAAWATERATYVSAYLLSALITVPTSVAELVAEVQQQALVYLWWDERQSLVNMRAVRGLDADPPLISEEDNIIADSFSLSEKPRERASQVWIYYAQQDFVKAANDPKAYAQVAISVNLESETANLYGEPSIRKIFARWLSSGALAGTTASKIAVRYVDVPSICTFSLDAKDRDIWVGDVVKISHHLCVDQYGNRHVRNWTIVSAEETTPGEVVQYIAEDTTLYGRIRYIMAAGAANYPGPSAPFKNAYIGNSAGLLSDGTASARIS